MRIVRNSVEKEIDHVIAVFHKQSNVIISQTNRQQLNEIGNRPRAIRPGLRDPDRCNSHAISGLRNLDLGPEDRFTL